MRWILLFVLLAAPLLAQDEDPVLKLRRIVEQLEAKDPKKRRAAAAELRALAYGPRVSVAVDPERGGETMSGSASVDGRSYLYSLKSTGSGHYRLEGVVVGKDGKRRSLDDEGTLRRLRQRYAFLRTDTSLWPSRPRRPAPATSLEAIGLTLRAPSKDLRYHFWLPPGAGFVVDRVEKGSRGAKLGLKPHDIVLKLNGEYVDDPKQLEKRGPLEVIRRGKIRKLKG